MDSDYEKERDEAFFMGVLNDDPDQRARFTAWQGKIALGIERAKQKPPMEFVVAKAKKERGFEIE